MEQLNPTAAPIVWPRVTIGKQTLEVKFSMLAEFILSQWGIDTNEIFGVLATLQPGKPAVVAEDGTVVEPAQKAKADPRFTSKIFELFAACVAHNYTQLSQQPPQAIYWASVIEEGQFPELARSVYEAMGKRRTVAQKTAPAPGLEAEPAAVIQ